jgi:hypothetical protein
MPTDAYFSRLAEANGQLLVPPGKDPLLIASLGPLRGGSYVIFAKVVVVTRSGQSGDSARAEFSLEAGKSADTAMSTLWHSSDRGALQPADTVSLQLPVKLTTLRTPAGKTPRPGPEVRLYCTSILGTLELRDIVITAIRVDSLTDLSPAP